MGRIRGVSEGVCPALAGIVLIASCPAPTDEGGVESNGEAVRFGTRSSDPTVGLLSGGGTCTASTICSAQTMDAGSGTVTNIAAILTATHCSGMTTYAPPAPRR